MKKTYVLRFNTPDLGYARLYHPHKGFQYHERSHIEDAAEEARARVRPLFALSLRMDDDDLLYMQDDGETSEAYVRAEPEHMRAALDPPHPEDTLDLISVKAYGRYKIQLGTKNVCEQILLALATHLEYDLTTLLRERRHSQDFFGDRGAQAREHLGWQTIQLFRNGIFIPSYNLYVERVAPAELIFPKDKTLWHFKDFFDEYSIQGVRLEQVLLDREEPLT